MSWQALTWAQAQKVGNVGAKSVLVILANYADEAGTCWPSQTTIAEATDQSKRTVIRQLQVLEEKGLIRVEQRGRSDGAGGRMTNRYVLQIDGDNLSLNPPSGPRLDDNLSQGLSAKSEGLSDTAVTQNHTLEPQEQTPSSDSLREPDRDDDPTDEVLALCDHLADWIERNGNKRPKIGKRWYQACRLMIEVDDHTPAQIRNAIDWCQKDPFWSSNILSMPKLREKYATLRLRAKAQAGQAQARPQHLQPLPSYTLPPRPSEDELTWDTGVAK